MRRKTGRKSFDNWLVIVIDVNLLLEPDNKHDEKEEPFPGQNYWIMDRRRLLIKIPKWKCSSRSHRRHNLWNPFEEKIRDTYHSEQLWKDEYQILWRSLHSKENSQTCGIFERVGFQINKFLVKAVTREFSRCLINIVYSLLGCICIGKLKSFVGRLLSPPVALSHISFYFEQP